MGGFAGGDEAGYWDNTRFRIAPSSTHSPLSSSNIQLHLDTQPVYAHVTCDDTTCATITFVLQVSNCLSVSGLGKYPDAMRIIASIYEALLETHEALEVEEFFQQHHVQFVLENYTTTFIDTLSIAFVRLLKEEANLMLSDEELANLLQTCLKI
jgi:hypothetical protein